MSRAGAHAGRLHAEEQFVFAMVFALMAGFVVVITMAAARSPLNPLLGGLASAAGSQTVLAGTTGASQQAGGAGAGAGSPVTGAGSARLNVSLAAAMSSVLRTHPGRLAVGVIDEGSGKRALYAATQPVEAGSLVTTDILAALLLRQRQAGAPVTGEQSVMASAMMKNASATATMSLWRAIGEGNGLASANRLLRLTHTLPGAGDQWDQTRTTVADQLQLLTDLTSSRSPLAAADRQYVLRLMGVYGEQSAFGVQAALGASAAGAGTAKQASLLPAGKTWVADSIGVVVSNGRVLLLVVLSTGSASRQAGASLASAAAVAAAGVMTHAGR